MHVHICNCGGYIYNINMVNLIQAAVPPSTSLFVRTECTGTRRTMTVNIIIILDLNIFYCYLFMNIDFAM